jgi:hypothetical protein
MLAQMRPPGRLRAGPVVGVKLPSDEEDTTGGRPAASCRCPGDAAAAALCGSDRTPRIPEAYAATYVVRRGTAGRTTARVCSPIRMRPCDLMSAC